jgi:hypothetical protein
MDATTLRACCDELIKISSDVLRRRAEDFWEAKSRAADAGSSRPSARRASEFWAKRSGGAAKKGGKAAKKGLGLLARILG